MLLTGIILGLNLFCILTAPGIAASGAIFFVFDVKRQVESCGDEEL